MAAIHNYYRILGIKTTAGIQEINQAIAALRQKDAAGNYSATINTIAATLSGALLSITGCSLITSSKIFHTSVCILSTIFLADFIL